MRERDMDVNTHAADRRVTVESQPLARRQPSGSGEAGSDLYSTVGTEKALSRRKLLKRAVGLAAVGVTGGFALGETLAAPALAATTKQKGAVAPTVVALRDAPTITVDASLGNDFRVTIAGNRTMGNPSHPMDGQHILLHITQGAGAPFTIAWASHYEFSAGLRLPDPSTAVGQTDLFAFIYNATKGKWLLVAYVIGFGGE
jgi:hypothetical protein